MKDFDRNDWNNENEPINQTNHSNENEQINEPATNEYTAEPAKQETPAAEPAKTEPAPQNSELRPNPQDNPYFRGYAAPQSYQPYSRPTQPQNPPMQGQYGQPVNGQQGQPINHSSAPQGQMNGQNPYHANPYVQQSQYRAPQQGDGQISYTPSYAKPKKAKKPITRGTIAVACVVTLLFSTLFGFGGAMAANYIARANETETTTPPVSNTAVNSDPVVIYRNVEEVATSTGMNGEVMTYAQVAAMVKDSVVEIVTEFNNQSVWYQYVTTGAGSGVIISQDGYIITNAHVITDESSTTVADNIIVRLANGEEHTAQTIAYDPDSDIAILKIEATGLTPAQCGNSDNLAVGEELVIVGNPLGELGGTVTNGIVSATEREITVGGVTMSLIQTNAAVNPGNSGGGMFNMNGQLVGIVNAKSSGSDIEGLGFAIPINYALEISEQLLEFGYVRGKTMIGVTFQNVSSGNYFYYYNIKPGVYVMELAPGYNDKNLKVGDRVIAVNGEEITSSDEIKAIISDASVGDTLTFQLYRDNKLMDVEVTCFEKVPDANANIQFEDGTAETTPEGTLVPEEGADVQASPFPDFFGDIFS